MTSANPLQVRDIRPSILLALETILCSWIFQDNLLSTSRPKSLNSETTSRCFIHTEISLYCLRFFRYSHYFAFLNVKIHSVQFTPRPKIIKVFLKQCVTSTIVNYPRSFVVVSIKGNGITRIDDIREITDENDKKEWALDRSLGNSRCNIRPGRVLVINDDSLITIREVVCTLV